jgi:RHS repeat-associated protein
MKIITPKIVWIIIAVLSISSSLYVAGNPPSKSVSTYTSPSPEGLIGVTEENPIDNPADNIFHVAIEGPVCSEDKLWLVYDLEGVEDHTSVSRSINDQRAVGGYLVKRRRGWATQREQVSAAWLRTGDNVLRFTLPEGATHSYRVKNLRIEIEKEANTDPSFRLVLNRPSLVHYQDKAYLKGFITGTEIGQATLKIDEHPVPVFNGEFESVIARSSFNATCRVEIEVTHKDGTTTCHPVEFSQTAFADYIFTRSSSYKRTEHFFETSSAQSIQLDGAMLQAEAGSLAASTHISITTLRDVDLAAPDAGMVNVTKHHDGYRFLPHGTTFLKETKLTIPFDETKVPDGYTEKDIKTYYFDEQAHHWIVLPTDTVLLETGLVVSKATHFTDYINAIIKVPESPEVEAYNSTSMKGIKAANPTAAVNLINPPQANNTGSAALNYPINIPAGRGGMQPQLAISYNSGGGNGWMGLGWNLTIPSIGIETRWGVPRFDAAKETETYTMNGEMLTPVAHRSEPLARSGGKKQFYPRVEGAFNRIERYGDNPANYYWVVTDKGGTKYFYGASGGSGNGVFDASAVLNYSHSHDSNDTEANKISQWCLREVRDLNGNTVKYHYAKVEDKGVVNGTVSGYQIYIDKITYTGHNGSDGKYAVIFTRDRELGETKRKDISITANLSFKQVTADLLRKIEVQFEDKNIRSYELKYKQGEFYKTLLSSISEFDSKGNIFNTHELDYYNDVNSGSTLNPFKSTEAWNIPSDGIEGGLLVSKVGFDDNASALSGNKSTDFGFGMTVTVGVNDGNLMNKSNTLGGSFGYSESETDGKLFMIDINGDGLTDKVMADDNGFRYRANLSREGTPRFSEKHFEIKNAGDFYKDKSKTTNFGFEAQAGFGDAFSAFIGAGRSKTTSVTSVYFTDVNGDQLPDLIKNGVAHFNHLDTLTGIVTFLPSSDLTPSPIASGGSVASGIFEVDPQELEADIDANPLHDVVRMWRAPYAGQVSIKAPVKLINTGKQAPNADGIKVSIQRNGNPALWTKQIQANDFVEYTPTGVNNISVSKGDRIYFRLQSVFNGELDVVDWSPVIEYIGKNHALTDANNNKLYRFTARDEFVLSAPLEIATPIAGRIKIESVFEKPQTTDDVRVEIIRKSGSTQTVIFNKVYNWNQTVNDPIDLDLTVAVNESFLFKVTAATNVDWPALRWRPHLYYTESFDPNVTELFRNGQPVISYFAVPDYSLFANAVGITAPWVVSEEVDFVSVKPIVHFPTAPAPGYNGEVIFSIKKRDTLVFKKNLVVTQGVIDPAESFTVTAGKKDTLYFEYHAKDEAFAEAMTGYEVVVTEAQKDSTFQAGLYTRFFQKEDFIYGTLHRQWGHFAYNGNRDRANQPINEADLKLSDKLQREYNSGDVQNPGDLNGSDPYDPSKENFIMLFAKGKEQVWSGYDEFTYLNATRMSSSRMGDDDITPIQAVPGGSGSASIRAINKINKSTSNSLSGGVGFSGVGNGSANTSSGSARLVSDFMDLNGDRYPDIVTEKGVQFTKPTGVLQDGFKSFSTGNITETTTSSKGASAGGFVKIIPKGTAGNAKAVKSDVGGAKVSGTISVNYGEGDNTGNYSWQDVNGDGLPDRVYATGFVQLNLGYRLSAPEQWAYAGTQVSESKSAGAGLGFSVGVGSESSSISGGIGLSRSDNETARSLQDVNGDGLIDEVLLSGGVKVKLNTGNGFTSSILTDWAGASKINESSTTGESANAAFTGCITFVVIPIKLCFNPSGNIGQSMSRDEARLDDVDGDGFPDYLVSENDGDLKVKRSTIDRTNLLKGVKRPLGATFVMDYERVGNTYDMPNNVWTLSAVKVFDGFKGDGVDSLLTTFTYEDGRYDRHERDFYGFKKVITNTRDTGKENKPVYTSVAQTFSNDNYYEKGLMLTEIMTDGTGNKFVDKSNRYQLKDIRTGAQLPESIKTDAAGAAFPALVETSQKFYEGQSTAGKSTSMAYDYDALGNVTTYTDRGDEGDDDNLSATITYHDLDALYVKGTPRMITVTGNGTQYRKREAVIDPNTGDITQIKQFLNDTQVATHDMEYDQYGNLVKITRPKNSKDQRLSFAYEYDDEVETYTTKVSNSYGYTSEAVYDFRYGQVLKSKDLNGNEIVYELDDLGRVKNITGPYEKGGANKTIAFEYFPNALVPYALTDHFDPANPKNKMQTAIFVDGLGRVLQTKKDVALYDGDGKADKEAMAVSGRVLFDAFGRTTTAYYPRTENKGDAAIKEVNKLFDEVDPTTTTYDVLNRTLKVVLPDKAETKTEYGFANDRNGKQQFSTKTTDANGKQTEQFTDVRGRVTAVKNYTTEKEIWTSFKYNAINEQIEATDDLGHTTFSLYDNFGRRIERRHPDAGTTNYSYDLAGNLKELVTANLAKAGQAILYAYDFERLTEITYPENTENNVKYTYGEAGATDNRAGRIVLQEDASGAQEFFYGPLGEVVKNVRTIVLPKFGEDTYVTEWTYDTWNRLTSMVYADGEKVDYTYNVGGLLRSMDGKKKNSTYSYVKQLGYDKFEQRVFLAYGNGIKTTYKYEEDRRRLKNMTAQTTAKRLFMDNVYTYDKVNNILSLENKAPIPNANLMGGTSEYSYSYDDLYRLTAAEGNYKSKNDDHSYTLLMQYNSVGGITNKTQNHTKKGNLQKKTSYNNTYTYGTEQPHAPIHIGGTLAGESGKGESKTYTYDANGNQTGWDDDLSGQRRNLMWDEENRIRSVQDNGAIYHYAYDAAGERVWKAKSTGQRVFVNGEWKAGNGQMGNYTVYVNPYIVLKSGGYTKHYYIEGQRIVSKLGGGWDNNGKGPLKAGDGKVDYATKGQKVFDGIVKNLKFLGADGQILTAGKSGKIPPGQINGNGNGNGGGNNVTEAFRYFYHPDHLGSTSYITDASGEVYQHLEYTAWGETFVEEHSNTDRTPYLFNGKELDEETGLYYYGARYYDAKTSVWQSVDPLSEEPEQEGKSPYAYTWNNPVRYDDPDGKCPLCAVVGAGVGALIGGGIEAGMQLYRGEDINWRKVGGSALQGAITGGAAGLTGGASLLVSAGTAAGANVVGGALNRAIQGKETTISDVAIDATIGAGLSVAGTVAGKFVKGAVDDLSNAAKGKLGEAVTQVKYAAQGYKSGGKAVVETGKKTATGKVQVAKYDHEMSNVFTGSRLTVESKFNTAGLTPNQVAARSNVTTPGGLIVDRTTSQQVGNTVKAVVTGSSGQIQRD